MVASASASAKAKASEVQLFDLACCLRLKQVLVKFVYFRKHFSDLTKEWMKVMRWKEVG